METWNPQIMQKVKAKSHTCISSFIGNHPETSVFQRLKATTHSNATLLKQVIQPSITMPMVHEITLGRVYSPEVVTMVQWLSC